MYPRPPPPSREPDAREGDAVGGPGHGPVGITLARAARVLAGVLEMYCYDEHIIMSLQNIHL